MSVLSDKTILELNCKSGLIVGGDENRVRHCSYPFRPGKIFHSGEKRRVVDWTSSKGDEHDEIAPGEYVWIRMREAVNLPNNLCGFWWQTNSLSRKGLLLMNMSMVEPGYYGPLSCLFVNFGQVSVSLHPSISMAKLVFIKLDHNALVSFEGRGIQKEAISEYDSDVHSDALARPTTFLQVTEQFSQLEQKAKDALDSLNIESARLLEEARLDFQKDIPSAIRKSATFAAGVLALLLLLSTLTPWLQSQFKPGIEDVVRESVEREIAGRIVLPTKIDQLSSTSTAGVAQNEAVLRQLIDIDQRLRKIEEEDAQPGG